MISMNDDVLKKIVALAEVGEGDRVLEVGPGIGTLTIALLKHAASVIAIERDERTRPALEEIAARYPGKLELHFGDALEADIGALAAGKPALHHRRYRHARERLHQGLLQRMAAIAYRADEKAFAVGKLACR